MKTRNKLSIFAGIAALALVGTGYAAWQFNTAVDNTITDSAKVFNAIEAKEVQVGNETIYLIADACAESGHNHKAGAGIYWASDAEGTTKITTVELTGSVNYEANDIQDFSKYIGHFEVSSTATSGTYVVFGDSAASADVTSTAANADVKYTYTLPTVSYATCPESVAGVTALRAELASDITFTVNFNVKDVIA